MKCELCGCLAVAVTLLNKQTNEPKTDKATHFPSTSSDVLRLFLLFSRHNLPLYVAR